MKILKISAIAAAACLLASSANADDAKPKRQLKGNMMEVYNTLPSSANNITEAFANGVFYGRLRMNAFRWDWKSADTASNKDNKAFGLGGSIIYKTAPLSGVSATAALYYANSPFSALRDDNADVGATKAGKDTFSRRNVDADGDWSMTVLGQAYLQYDISKTTFKVGRQIFESFLTKSNDTKMIPNTFEGYSVEMKEIPKTTIRAAYFTAQKLRDHTTFHDVIAFGTANGTTANADKWANNDDAGVHKGLTFIKLNAVGKAENELIVADIRNKSIENLQLDLTYGSVPGLISSITGEINYKINLPGGFSLTPGIRHMQQMDKGAGEIGGASLSGTVTAANATASGYKDGDSLDSSLTMARLVLNQGPLKFQIAYSAVADEGDIVAPWRGFPTGGYTRAMAQYNWRANTKTTAAEVKYDFGKANMIPGFTAMARYAIQNFDEDKQAGGVQADSNILHMDFIKKVATGLEAKLRIGLISADDRISGSTDKDSYNEYRFELNYLF
ncbi:OprD family outer membrane porin [Candidatus Sulfurimonas baltica]|uniref:Outer membrane porin, OprD family n=1 Tax=Candidatus Sulfurimonas baltica TaxID=2740404 RepID=A0A7S7LUN2_9BACT|nr:OprD family outer membrane porin [Candidatus Sulfurimonas baltica]QOY51782.1 outer membrane porin, OprD family [Candidatus Sulfurimonas baltica]